MPLVPFRGPLADMTRRLRRRRLFLFIGALLLDGAALPLRALPLTGAPGRLAPAAPALPAAVEIRPTDWLHQALRQMDQEQSCAVPALRSLLDGGQPLNRDEAATLVQACLDTSGQVRGELVERLQREFAPELARLQGRFDGVEARLGTLEATQFTTTSTLKGDVRWWLGGVDYGGNQIDRAANSYGGRPLRNAFVFNYDVRLAFNTSFEGDDLLRVRLRSGNGGFSPFRDVLAPTLRMDGLSPGCSPNVPCRNNLLLLDKLFYQRPLGPHLRMTVGSRVNQRDMIAIWPAVFDDNENLLALFGKGGAPGAYSDVKGAGAGIYWIQRATADAGVGWVLSAVTVSGEPGRGQPSRGGLFSAGSSGASTLQVGYQAGNWAAAAAYTVNQAGALDRPGMTPLAAESWPRSRSGLGGHVHSFGLNGFWQPPTNGWMPSITLGWGYNANVFSGDGTAGIRAPQVAESQSWMVGLNWYDVLLSGSELAFAIGTPVSVSRYRNPDGQEGAADQAIQMELWCRLQATDWLTVTPGVFWLPRPRGQLTAAGSTWDSNPLPLGRGASFSALGAVLKLRIRF